MARRLVLGQMVEQRMRSAAAKLFRASLTNLEAYRAEVGDIDESLGELLLSAAVADG